MDTKQIEKFSVEAREQLLKDVEQRLYTYGLDDAGRGEFGPDSDVVRGTVLAAGEKAQRSELYRRVEDEGADVFVEEMAYTWFNRLAALRYMELHDFLSNHVRVLSAADGSFEPECLRAATTLELPGLNRSEVAQLIQAGDDEALYRTVLVAQMNELASALPTVFGTVTADALTLPSNLLRKSEFNVLYRLATDIPEDAWQSVEILGWMYQFYNSERKREFFDSKRKATEADLAPATQLFTPEWIVRYMVDNSLGRLWMLNHPDSRLREYARAEDPNERLMEYYIEPDEEHEDFIRVSSPEEVTFCDPACGSGHILVYAFRMLMAIYEECGYREREIPELILTKNLSGFEIDPRAAQIATLVLALCAREHDRRFFGRGVTADITVLRDVHIDVDELPENSPLREKNELLESLAHLGEIGSLLQPTESDIAALEASLSDADSDSLFVSRTNDEVKSALAACRILIRRFDVVVANPPYMGSSKLNLYMSKWVAKHYPDVKSDLFSSFVVRIMSIAEDHGEVGMMTPYVWMFISSYEKLRNELIDEKAITSLVQLEYSGFAGATVPICTFTFHNAHIDGYRGGYVRLSDFVGASAQGPKTLEAIQNPDCGWFYRVDATTFHDIPGSPIAYWIGMGLLRAFQLHHPLKLELSARVGMISGDNNRFIRRWTEVSKDEVERTASPQNVSNKKWVPLQKGGDYRLWYGNLDYVINWGNDGWEIKNDNFANGRVKSHNYNGKFAFCSGITWNSITSSRFQCRYSPEGFLFDAAGPLCQVHNLNYSLYILGLMSSSVFRAGMDVMNPTMNFPPNYLESFPIIIDEGRLSDVNKLVDDQISLSKVDWDSQETSLCFKRSPLL